MVTVIFAFWLLPTLCSYTPILNRRSWIHHIVLVATTATLPTPTFAVEDPRSSIQQAQSTLATLLENWQRATVDCTFADVPRDLLEQKNKELLLEKASTYALFDKSVSVETCKTTNRIVRDYLGVTGKGPLVGMDKKLKQAMEYVDVNYLNDYFTGTFGWIVERCVVMIAHSSLSYSLLFSEMEAFSTSMSKAASLSYTAGIADFDSVNNFSKENFTKKEDSNLEQARRAIVEAKTSLDKMLIMME